MEKPKATQIYGVLVLAVSAYLVWHTAISPLIRWLGARGHAADDAGLDSFNLSNLFEWTIRAGVLAVVGVMIHCGIGLVKNRPLPPWAGAENFPEEERWRGQIVVDPVVTYVRLSLAILAALGAVLLSAILSEQFPSSLPESIRSSLAALLCLLVVLALYVVVVRLLLRGRGYWRVELRYVIGKAAVALIAVLLCMNILDFVEWRWPEGDRSSSSYAVPGQGWLVSMAFLFGPIILAVLFYKTTVRLLCYQQIDLDLRRAGLRSSPDVFKSNNSKK